MRRRVMTVYLTLLVLTCIGLAVPLGIALAQRATTAVVLDRTADAARFASLAEASVVSGRSGLMTAELGSYHELFGIDALVVDREGGIVARGRPGFTLDDLASTLPRPDALGAGGAGGLPEPVQAAMAGTRGGSEHTVYPWTSHPLVVLEPVGSAGEIVGVVVTASPTSALRAGLAAQWTLVVAGVLLVLAAGFAAAGPLTRWVLRPVAELDAAAQAVGSGSLRTRVEGVAGPDELQHLAGSFNDMVATVNALLERQRTVVAYAGHQIRNPLAALLIRLEGLGLRLPPEDQPMHRTTLDELDRLARTCDGLLALAETDEEHLDRSEVDVAVVVADRVRAWEPIARRTGARLVDRSEPGLWVRLIDGTLDQALDALIDNALKFGGEGVEVTLAAEAAADGSIVVQVSDDGPGLPAGLGARLSGAYGEQPGEPFGRPGPPTPDDRRDRLDPLKESGGSGLGLSIVVTLLHLDGGRLELQPSRPHGVLARITLPSSPPR